MDKINGREVVEKKVFEEGGFWRWQISDALGQDFNDGGNLRTREEAETNLAAALDPTQ